MLTALLAFVCAVLPTPSAAGELSRADLERRFAPPLRVGDKAADVPAWPISSELAPDDGPVGWVFESVDIAPIPGFEGTPINLLIVVDPRGNFISVEVLSQHEPVFVGGLGEAPLQEFVRQYASRNLRDPITVSTRYGQSGAGSGGGQTVLDGVTKATASVRIVNQTVLSAAVAVARARLGFAAASASGPAATAREDHYERRSFDELLDSGAIARRRVSNRDAEALFADSDAAGLDADALAALDDEFVEIYVAWLNAPSIGRAILGDAGFDELRRVLEPGQQAWWVATAGRGAFLDEDFVRGTAPARLALRQGGVPFELRDADLDPPVPPGAPPLNAALVLKTAPLAGIDPGGPQDFALTLVRQRGAILPEITRRDVELRYQAPEAWLARPPSPPPEWLLAWQARSSELAVIGAVLVLLAAVLARPRWLSVSPRRLRAFRLAFLAFTLGYLGWYAQGQLSIVQLTGVVKMLAAGQGLGSFLYDPISLLVIAFTLASFVVWGRGTFCGWLCPFGALQEFAARLGAVLGVRPRRLPPWLARALGRGRYALLVVLLAAAAFAPQAAEPLVEVEPFKTAITVGFDRAWPFVAYAVLLLALGAVYYKFFCRYLCPLGAAMVVGGRLRALRWLPRRRECGKPCQRCRNHCAYDAITPDGAIRYDDCFQCLDCVGLYHDPGRCVPVRLMRTKGRRLGDRPPESQPAHFSRLISAAADASRHPVGKAGLPAAPLPPR
ncbi:MAG: 4Fe-4S binding protein [Aromatoleum sp.]|uniref:4Fe-4S binding protein n=1 Tax=Aromatoleum sp. TaxID=2307007 RepID=UPI0028940AE6|nr:4Fe-4S binding protein [Aromatoleum sp.]MDT3669350.1 4Fe-4S binding protein [Aromatoleum sp.]